MSVPQITRSAPALPVICGLIRLHSLTVDPALCHLSASVTRSPKLESLQRTSLVRGSQGLYVLLRNMYPSTGRMNTHARESCMSAKPVLQWPVNPWILQGLNSFTVLPLPISPRRNLSPSHEVWGTPSHRLTLETQADRRLTPGCSPETQFRPLTPLLTGNALG